MRPALQQRGMTLFLVIMLLSVLGIIAFYIHTFSRRQLHQSDRLGSAEIAFQVAEFGAQQGAQYVRKAVDFLNSTAPETFPKGDKAPPALKSFFQGFVKGDGRLTDEPVEVALPIAGTPLTEVTGAFGSEIELQVKLKLDRSGPLLEGAAAPGVQESPFERRGRFIIDSSAQYRGVKKRVIAVFEQRTIHLQMPVLGRFTLFVGEVEGPLNSARVSLVSGLVPPRSAPQPSPFPLVIFGGPKYSPAEQAASFQDPAGFLDRQGWIFLGTPTGKDPEHITLGVAPGDSGLGEDFLLQGKSLFIYDIQQGSKVFGIPHSNSTGVTLKLWETHQRYACLTGLYKETKTVDRHEILALEPKNTEQPGIIRCMGYSKEPSPTIVFGKVYRSYILERGIRRKPAPPAGAESPASAAVLPFIPGDRFNDPSWPGTQEEALQILKSTCGNDWNGYSQGMTSLIVAPYNESLAYFFDSRRQNSTNRSLLPTFQLSAIPKLGKGLKYAPSSPRAMILDGPTELFRNDQQVFSGEMQQVLPNIGSLVLGRCGREVDSAKDLLGLFKELEKKSISATGFYHVKGPFTWTAEFNRLALGGVGIVADGDVRVTDRIMPIPPPSAPDLRHHPIILVSLTGNLIVSTTQPLNAGLYAPLGEFRLEGAQGLDLTGTLAVKKLNVNTLSSPAPKVIRYDPAHDWTDQQAFAQSFRVMLEHQPLVFQAKQ